MQAYGADKAWRQLNREGERVARCTVERLMKHMGQGARRGRIVRTTTADPAIPCPLDRINRQFKANRPNQLWVSDFTYVSTWQGWLYVAFVIDVFARRIVGGASVAPCKRTSSSMSSNRLSIRHTERLAQVGIVPSVGSRGDSYDNALAELINGLYKAELIHAKRPGRPRRRWSWPPWNGYTLG